MSSSVSNTFRVRHRTAYQYTSRIDLCHSIAHLAPRPSPNQETINHQIEVTPTPSFSSSYQDFLGNTTHYFSVQEPHRSLDIVSHLSVKKTIDAPQLPISGQPWETIEVDMSKTDGDGVPLAYFLLPTRACPREAFIQQFVQPSMITGLDIMELTFEVMKRIHQEFKFVSGSTQTSTSLETVIEQRMGVCQDFAHLMIAALRMTGIPTRYVSGYLETIPPPGQKKLIGVDASHAWIETYTPTTGWVGFDPTNNKLPDAQYIKICHGRDYFDVQPVKGSFIGSGKQTLKVEVDVTRL